MWLPTPTPRAGGGSVMAAARDPPGMAFRIDLGRSQPGAELGIRGSCGIACGGVLAADPRLGGGARRTVELVLLLLLQGSRRQRLGRAGAAHGLMSGRRP